MRILILSLILSFPSAYALDLNLRSPLVSPYGDCPYLPSVYRNNRKYDRLIRRAVVKHWPAPLERDWCMWKAQICAESALNPRATSPVGRQGSCAIHGPWDACRS